MDRELRLEHRSLKRRTSLNAEYVQASELLHVPDKKKQKQTETIEENDDSHSVQEENIPLEVVGVEVLVQKQSNNSSLCNGSLCDDVLSYILLNYITRFSWIKHLWLTGDASLQRTLSRTVTTVIFPKFNKNASFLAPECRKDNEQIAYLSKHFPNIHSLSINLDRNLILLPSKLKSLTVESYLDNIDGSILPDTITSLRLLNTRFYSDRPMNADLNLSSLQYTQGRAAKVVIPTCTNMIRLDCPGTDLDKQKLVTYNMESLSCSINSFSDWQTGMPPFLTTLILSQNRVDRLPYVYANYWQIIPNIINLLPQSLTSLSIQFYWLEQGEMPHLDPLPRQLTRLNFPALSQIGILISCCPSTIKEIIHRVSVQSPSDVTMLTSAFPKLTSIAIDTSWFCGPNGRFVPLDLSNMSNLLKLDMIIKPHKSDGSISFRPIFPLQLQSLTIKALKKFKLTRRFVRSLPGNLFHFYAVGFGDTGLQGSGRQFQRIAIDDIYILDSLPETICQMAIDSDKNLHDLNDVIPPNLHTFYSCKYRQTEEGNMKDGVVPESKFNFNILDKYGGDRFKTYKLECSENTNRLITILGSFGGSPDDFGTEKEFKFDF